MLNEKMRVFLKNLSKSQKLQYALHIAKEELEIVEKKFPDEVHARKWLMKNFGDTTYKSKYDSGFFAASYAVCLASCESLQEAIEETKLLDYEIKKSNYEEALLGIAYQASRVDDLLEEKLMKIH